jgi:hypothetical protein
LRVPPKGGRYLVSALIRAEPAFARPAGHRITGGTATTLLPLGLDVSKLEFNACLLRAGGKFRHKVFNEQP